MLRKGLLLLFICLPLLSVAVPQDQYVFQDLYDEHRFHEVLKELRCLVCQNQTLSESTSTLAQDLRREVYTQIRSGRTSDEVKTFMVERYSDFILYKPPLSIKTILLWTCPILMLILGLYFIKGQLYRESSY